MREKVGNMLKAYEDGTYEEMAKFGAYFRSKYGISPSTAISVILGCFCLYMLVKRLRGSKQKPVLHRSGSIASLYGGDLALKRLDDYNAAISIPYVLERSDLVLKGLLEEEHLDLKKLQTVTARLEMAGKEEEGVRLLNEAKTKNARLEKSHHVYEIEMLLLEMLIYMGQLDEAQKCDCIKHKKIIAFDARRPLFKALIYEMRQNEEKAKSNWDKFVELRQDIMTLVGKEQLEPGIKDFEGFKEKVQHLQDEMKKKKKKPFGV
ncbi:uncharacterized protein LOC114722442 [Neltuma alba]|uniref:uncharacterized protein LOC114722442 n=1 Tax=Neltuma alba TaxID=207710 RepID=UPI0010A2EBA3|nr:uncharacterized protein LOC114722442 [Prosopis alba]